MRICLYHNIIIYKFDVNPVIGLIKNLNQTNCVLASSVTNKIDLSTFILQSNVEPRMVTRECEVKF